MNVGSEILDIVVCLSHQFSKEIVQLVWES